MTSDRKNLRIEALDAESAGEALAQMPRLCERTVARLPDGVQRPAYDREATRIGAVHFGPGAFHRAHQGYYFDRLLARDPRWAISAVSLRTNALREALAPQDGLYTLVELDERPAMRVLGPIRELLATAEDSSAVSRRLCDPDTSLVTLTVTEKGYCLDGARNLDLGHPDILHDLHHPENPLSVIGWLARGLQLRRERALAPYLVVSCDNLSENGTLLRNAVLQFATARDPGLAGWIEENVRFPSTMVDSITPATDDALRTRVTHVLGLRDLWPVQRERFVQWVIEETDGDAQPDWASVGVTVSRDVSAYERAKLRLLNGAHSTLAYVGLLLELETVAQAMAQPALGAFVERMMREDIEPTLGASRTGEIAAYRRAILRRFENPAIAHRLAQIAWDGSQKLPIRILATMSDALRAHRPLGRLAVPVAAWMQFVRTRALAGTPIVDPLQIRLTACGRHASGDARHDLALFLGLPGVFPAHLAQCEDFVRTVSETYARISRDGVLAVLRSG